MKTLKTFTIIALVTLSMNLTAQIKVNSAGSVGLGTSSSPSYSLDAQGPIMRFYTDYTSGREPIYLAFWGADPRIVSENKVVFFNTSQTGFIDIQCRTLYELSDSTGKRNIQKIEQIESLEKILSLKGVTYSYKDDKSDRIQAGFLAQEVEKIIPEAVTSIDSTNTKLMNYNAIIAYLVEAIKEQQLQIEELSNFVRTNDLELKSANNVAEHIKDDAIASKAILYQNYPNPFSKNTDINYYLPDEVKTASLNIYNMQGHQIKSLTLHRRGDAIVTIYGDELQAGMYIYALIADKKIIDSKRMILTD